MLRVLALGAMAAVAGLVTASGAPAKLEGSNSTATITGAFADSCRDFAAHSSKDISHVELQYADGRVTKDESVNTPDFSIDANAGDEIDFAIVKSGTTRERFDCEATTAPSPPTAVLEIETPPVDRTVGHCFDFFSGGLACEQSSPRTVWTRASDIPDDGGSESGVFHWVCGALSDRSQCPFTITFRGTSSDDPDDDIASWSLDFGDGTSAGGTWSTDPPALVVHDYPDGGSCTGYGTFGSNVCAITLTVTDSAGRADSDTMVMAFVDQTPD